MRARSACALHRSPPMTRVEVDNLVCGAGRLRWICYLFAVASVAIAIAGLRAFDLTGPLTLLISRSSPALISAGWVRA